MNYNTYIELEKDDEKKLKTIWKNHQNIRTRAKALAILLSNKNCTVQCISKHINEPEQNIRNWYTKFLDVGFEMFDARKNIGGRPSILNDKEHLKFIKACVKRNAMKKKESILCIQKRLKKEGIRIKDASIVNYFKKHQIKVISLEYGIPDSTMSYYKNIRNLKITKYNDSLQKNKNIISIIQYLKTSTQSIIRHSDLPNDLQDIFSENENNSNTDFYSILLNYIENSVDETNEYIKEYESKLLPKQKKNKIK